MMRLGRRHVARRVLPTHVGGDGGRRMRVGALVLHPRAFRFEVHARSLAYQARQQCEQALPDQVRALKRSGFTDIKGGFPGSHELLAQKGGDEWRYYRLPDTVNPREPQGK